MKMRKVNIALAGVFLNGYNTGGGEFPGFPPGDGRYCPFFWLNNADEDDKYLVKALLPVV
jgi:hypothetical protein